MSAALVSPLPAPVRAMRPSTVRVVSLPPYRACVLCTYGTNDTGALCCTAPKVREAAALDQVPVSIARDVRGWCGPDATHLDMAGWR